MEYNLFNEKTKHDNLLLSIESLLKNYDKKVNNLILSGINSEENNTIIQSIKKRNDFLFKYKNILREQNNQIDNLIKSHTKRTERRVSILVATYCYNNKIYIGCHFDNTPKKYRYGRIQGAGGHVEINETFEQGIIRESAEEHGLLVSDENKLEFISENYDNNSNTRYKYYGTNVTPQDYYPHLVTTHDEIINDMEYINKIFDLFPKGTVINTNVKTTFLIDINILCDDKYKEYVYGPFSKFLKITK